MALLCGCAAFKPRPADPGFKLLSPAEAGFSATLEQSITLNKGTSSTEVMAVSEISPETVKLAVLSPLGNRVLSLEWDGKRLKQERDPSLPKEFPAELILRDLQLALWDEGVVRKMLPSSWAFEPSERRRVFSKNGQVVIVIGFSGDHFKDPIEFEHKALGYQLRIRSVKEDE